MRLTAAVTVMALPLLLGSASGQMGSPMFDQVDPDPEVNAQCSVSPEIRFDETLPGGLLDVFRSTEDRVTVLLMRDGSCLSLPYFLHVVVGDFWRGAPEDGSMGDLAGIEYVVPGGALWVNVEYIDLDSDWHATLVRTDQGQNLMVLADEGLVLSIPSD